MFRLIFNWGQSDKFIKRLWKKATLFFNFTENAIPDVLQKLSVPLVNTKDCKAVHQSMKTPVIENANICAGGKEGYLVIYPSSVNYNINF